MKAFIVCLTVSLDVKAQGSFQEVYTRILATPYGLVPAGIMIIYLRIKSTMNEVPYMYLLCGALLIGRFQHLGVRTWPYIDANGVYYGHLHVGMLPETYHTFIGSHEALSSKLRIHCHG